MKNYSYELYKLNPTIERLLQESIDDSGEIVNENSLALWENSVEAKNELLINCALELKNKIAHIQKMKEQIEEFVSRIDLAEMQVERLKEILFRNIDGELETAQIKVSIRKSKYTYVDPAKAVENLPEKYVTTKIKETKTISLSAIREDLEKGVTLDYAEIKERKNIHINGKAV